MTTRLYHRLNELGSQKNFYKGTTRVNIYHSIAEKAGCSVKEVANLAYDGPHSINVLTARKIIGAVGSIQGKAISENEMMLLFADDTTTVERNNSYTGLRRRYL
jgi:predicted transcriptional regulator